jgi:hypothetical protein
VPTIGSLTLEQWLNEYKRLNALNDDMGKAARQGSPGPAKTEKLPHETRTRRPPPHEAPRRGEPPRVPTRDSTRNQACSLKAKLLADLDQAHKDLVTIEDQEMRTAREGRVSDLVTLSAAANRERGKFDRALLAIRDHTLFHGC